MGLNKQIQTNALYLSQGEIIKAATKENFDFEKNGKYFERFKSISGHLTGLQIVKGYNEGEHDAAFTIKDGDEVYTMYMGLKSGYWRSMSRCLENANLMLEMEIFPTYKVENDIKKSSIIIKQNDTWLKAKYTYDNMGDLPQSMPVEVNGKTIYDNTAQNDFLIEQLKLKFAKEILPF